MIEKHFLFQENPWDAYVLSRFHFYDVPIVFLCEPVQKRARVHVLLFRQQQGGVASRDIYTPMAFVINGPDMFDFARNAILFRGPGSAHGDACPGLLFT